MPTSPTMPPVEARCVPATCVRLAHTVSCVVSEGEKGRGGRGRQGGRRGTKAASGCSATCVPHAQGPGHQGTARWRGSGRDASRIAPQSVSQRGKGRTGTGRHRAKNGGAWEGGQGRTREDEHTRGRAGPGSGSREGEQRGGLPRELLRTVLALAEGRR